MAQAVPMTRPCHPSQHHWRLAECLPLTLPDTSGWVRVLLQRVCRVCHYGELWVGEAHLGKQLVKLEEQEVLHVERWA